MKMTFKTTLVSALIATAGVVGMASGANAAGDVPHPKQVDWSFKGFTGTFDRAAQQRGFQVYKEVCAACHGLNLVAFRTLTGIGFSEAEVKAIAAEYTVEDGPNNDGDMFERPAAPSDKFPSPFPNDQIAMMANGGALPPDLSLMTKARMDGSNYVYSLLTGYDEAPEGFDVGALNYNTYFAGHKIAMAQPLYDDYVEYADGTPATLDQMAKDVTVFLTWAADPNLEARHNLGFRVMGFLLFLTVIFYFSNRAIWREVKGKK